MALGEEADTTTRQRRQLAEAAIAHATRGEWEDAVVANRQLLELGPDIDACNRLGKALAELGRHAEALKAYEQALERDATNRIAQRNIERLRVLMAAKRPATNGKGRQEKAPATLFIEEMGKTGRARLINMAAPRVLAPLSPGDAITLDVRRRRARRERRQDRDRQRRAADRHPPAEAHRRRQSLRRRHHHRSTRPAARW